MISWHRSNAKTAALTNDIRRMIDATDAGLIGALGVPASGVFGCSPARGDKAGLTFALFYRQ